MKRWLPLLLLLLVLIPAPAHSYTANEWLVKCEGNTIDRLICISYLNGVRDAQFIYNEKVLKNELRITINGITIQEPGYCVPKNVTTEQIKKVLIKWFNDHPERLHISMPVLFNSIITENFPCKDWLQNNLSQ